MVVLCLVTASAAPRSARADDVAVDALPDITDRDYAIDLYLGPALGSGRIVSMGGAAVALAEGSAGMLANPAAPGVRPATSKGTWDWDWHVDWLSPQLGSDFDRNGIPTTEDDLDLSPFVTGGVVVIYEMWALGVSVNSFQQDAGAVNPTFVIGEVSLARSFLAEQLVAGVGVRSGNLEITNDEQEVLFEIAGSALQAGAVWRPSPIDIRVGGTISLPVVGREVTVDNCDPMNCNGFILPSEVKVPWRLAGGFAWRRGPTRWNRRVAGEFRDERALTLAGDLVIFGSNTNAYGVEAFAVNKLQRSGATPSVSVRAGAEYEWKPGWFRVRGGSYWEPGRFQDELGNSIAGRLHATLGFDVRVYSRRVWGDTYRLRLSLTADGAEQYYNGGVSIGFWH
jgi:hypothetical protein